MQASTFKLKTNLLTGGRSHTPLAKSGALTMGLNFYTRAEKISCTPIPVKITPSWSSMARRRSTTKKARPLC